MSAPLENRRRRRLLGAFGALGIAVMAGANASRQVLINACRPVTPQAHTPWAAAVWQGLDPAKVWDVHVHLAGIGDSRQGPELGETMRQPLRHPLQYLQRQFYINGSCAAAAAADSVDAGYALRLVEQMETLPVGVKSLLLAFDHFHDDAGRALPERSTFYVPDAYACTLARRYPERFEWAASIHPYRADAIDRLQAAAANGARAVKWLPAAQNMDPASPKCAAFFAELARQKLPLLIHCGKESAVKGADRQALGNPLKLRRALAAGVKVIVAHCATAGEDADLDHGGRQTSSFELFARLMDAPEWRPLLAGDISAITLANRSPEVLQTLLLRTDWHARLLNGSDYPLPGILPLVWLSRLARAGLLPETAVDDLDALRQSQPLFFDLALKRALTWQGRRFPACVFETRDFFLRDLS